MTKHPISLSIFFPTFNEEANIEKSVRTAVRVADASPFISDFEVLVINDGSSDRTAEIVQELAREDSRVRLVDHIVNRGAGAALKTGFASATKDYVFYTDADLQFDILEINNLLLHINDYDAVIGYRAPRRDPFMRLLNAKGWNVLMRLFFGLKIRDIDCAFKIFRTDLVQSIDLKAEGAMTIAESLIRLTRKGVVFKQVPVSHLPRTAGNPTGAKLSVIARAFKEMITLYTGELGNPTQKQVMKFMTVGVINTAVDFLLYFYLTREVAYFANEITLARVLSIFGGTVSSYLLNRAWTFRVRGRFNIYEVIRFYSVTLLTAAINLAVMSFMTDVLKVYDLVAFVLATVFTFLFSFTFQKLWVFVQGAARTGAPSYTQN